MYDEIFHQAEAAAEAVRAMGKEAGANSWMVYGWFFGATPNSWLL